MVGLEDDLPGVACVADDHRAITTLACRAGSVEGPALQASVAPEPDTTVSTSSSETTSPYFVSMS